VLSATTPVPAPSTETGTVRPSRGVAVRNAAV